MKKWIAILAFTWIVFMGFYPLLSWDLDYPNYFPPVVYDVSQNPLNENVRVLGQALFYDPILSADNSISCASCHSPYNAFAHTDHQLSHGINDSIGKRNAPSLMNLAWQSSFMWDGSVHHLDAQALGPIEHKGEMGSDINEVLKRLNSSKLYRGLTQKAFGDSLITTIQFLKAIAQFELSLISADSKYDKILKDEAIYSLTEENGYELFKIHCASCHVEPLFTNHSFENNGLPIDSILHDKGRSLITLNNLDEYKFKVPTLRNVEYSYPYMHDGRFDRLSEVVSHYAKGIKHSNTLSEKLKNPIDLDEDQQTELVAFLLTLSDKRFVFNPKHQYPREILLPE